MSLKPNFVVLGDSAAFGTGDVDFEGKPLGWGARLAATFSQGCNYKNFSRPGAKSSEVLEKQLPLALEAKPDICAVVAGGNDLLRNGFSPTLLHANLKATAEKLINNGTTVVMIELHDPNQLLRLPKLLKQVLKRRVDAVNAVYRKLAEELDILLIPTRQLDDVHNIRNWHIDRMHPGPNGHQLLTQAIAAELAKRDWNIQIPQIQLHVRENTKAQWAWFVKNGAPWFLKRSVDLLPAALILMAIEAVRVER